MLRKDAGKDEKKKKVKGVTTTGHSVNPHRANRSEGLTWSELFLNRPYFYDVLPFDFVNELVLLTTVFSLVHLFAYSSQFNAGWDVTLLVILFYARRLCFLLRPFASGFFVPFILGAPYVLSLVIIFFGHTVVSHSLGVRARLLVGDYNRWNGLHSVHSGTALIVIISAVEANLVDLALLGLSFRKLFPSQWYAASVRFRKISGESSTGSPPSVSPAPSNVSPQSSVSSQQTLKSNAAPSAVAPIQEPATIPPRTPLALLRSFVSFLTQGSSVRVPTSASFSRRFALVELVSGVRFTLAITAILYLVIPVFVMAPTVLCVCVAAVSMAAICAVVRALEASSEIASACGTGVMLVPAAATPIVPTGSFQHNDSASFPAGSGVTMATKTAVAAGYSTAAIDASLFPQNPVPPPSGHAPSKGGSTAQHTAPSGRSEGKRDVLLIALADAHGLAVGCPASLRGLCITHPVAVVVCLGLFVVLGILSVVLPYGSRHGGLLVWHQVAICTALCAAGIRSLRLVHLIPTWPVCRGGVAVASCFKRPRGRD